MESEILKRLCTNIGNIVEIDSILNELWHDNNLYNRNSLRVHPQAAAYPSADRNVKILNVRGVGYKMIVGTSA